MSFLRVGAPDQEAFRLRGCRWRRRGVGGHAVLFGESFGLRPVRDELAAMRLAPFAALFPPASLATEVAAVPYDVVDTVEARALAADKPHSFLRVSRPELELPDGADPHADAVYAHAAANFARLQREGALRHDDRPRLYIYRIQKGDHVQTGVVACCHVGEYARGTIKRHENTRPDKETDRTRHLLALRAHSGPVFLTYPDAREIDALVEPITRNSSLAEAMGEDGSVHTIWRVSDAAALLHAFGAVPASYIADGHHRAAAAARAARELCEQNPAESGGAACNYFLAVLFPAGQLRILAYNRLVQDLHGLSEEAFLTRVRKSFRVTEAVGAVPAGPRQASMYLGGRWYGLAWDAPSGADPVAALDVSVLQDRLLGPVLGIDDPRTNARIGFVGGIRGTAALEQAVQADRAAVAFAMFPVTVAEMMAIADAGQIMPPKSTWFEPKLRDGLLVHTF